MKKILTLCLLLQMCLHSFAQSMFSLEGKIIDERSNPINGATVYVLNTQYNSITNEEGRFFIKNLSKGFYVLNITCIGFATVNKEIKTDTFRTGIEVVLAPDYKQLSDV